MRLVSVLYNNCEPFNQLSVVDSWRVENNPKYLTEEDILLLHGGEDISPSLYNHKVSKYTYAGVKPSARDTAEWNMLQRAIELGIPIIGICRGAQMVCAAAGGYLIQHVDNHSGRDHLVYCNDGTTTITNTCHHQMQYPFDVEHEMLMWTLPMSDRHIIQDNTSIDVEVEPETVYYPKIRAFAPQWHPEWMIGSEANNKLLKMIEDRL